jgi:P-type E1-E2 ATPase
MVDGQRVLVGNLRLLQEADVRVPPLSLSEGSELLVAVDGHYWGRLHVTDPLRTEAIEALQRLHTMGYKTVLLTGDVEHVARPLATRLGIDDVKADLLPSDKLQHIHALRQAGHHVAMVGDGVNDAPALSAAHLGIAMGSGTDIAKESADVVLIGNDLHKLVETLLIARQTRGVIWQNFAGTLGVDALGIGLAALGFLNPLLAAFIHVGSEMAFLLNSARLLKK